MNKIKDLHIPNNANFLSFDVKNLFPGVPPSEVLQITKSLLIKNNCNEVIREDLFYTFETCLEQNYFEFHRYTQIIIVWQWVIPLAPCQQKYLSIVTKVK